MSILYSANEFLSDLLAKNIASEELLAFKVEGKMKERYLELAEKNKLGKLTSEETKELEDFLFFDRVISLAKIKAVPSKK